MTPSRTGSDIFEVGVIIPTYNRADLIADTLHSVLRQSYPPAEVIVVDDGSRDNTEEVVRKFGSAVRYLRIENGGECRARNFGVAASSTKWVAFCDSDDLWLKDKLRLQVRLFEETPGLEYSFTNFRTVVNNEWSKMTKFDSLPSRYWELPQRQLGTDLFVVEAPLFDRLLTNQPIFPSTLMMKRSFFDALGRWNEPLGRTPSVDLEFHLRCVSRPKIGVVAAPVVGIRKHNSNFSGNPLRTAIGEIAILRYALEHNPTAKSYAAEIEKQIVERSARAAEGAFAEGNLEGMLQLLESVPPDQRSWKLKLKNLIARCPNALAQFLQGTVSALRSRGRTRADR